MEPENNDVELTMQDVLEEERELEEDAKAVLGDCDDKNCTYSEGYLPRQALYSCVTCSNSEPGGVCLACSYACHEGHELIELYTKRNFRCDCGNKKFKNNRCRLYQDKEPENVKNKYNQNFCGKYCTCSRPYPDLDDDTPDAMIQCVLCEDWYHGRHLGDHVPDNDDFAEMICGSCMESHSFIYAYTNCFPSFPKNVANSDVKTDNGDQNGSSIPKVENDPSEVPESNLTNSDVNSEIGDQNGSSTPKVERESREVPESNAAPRQGTTAESAVNVQDVACDGAEVESISGTDCFYTKLGNFKCENLTGPVFWPEDWRKVLCRCPTCLEMYENEQCLFLLDEGDTIHAYEERGKQRSGNESQYDKGWSALSSLDRVKQIEAVREYKEMESQLKDYLKHFADNKQTVSKRDITDFFDNIRNQKRQKVGNYVQTFCR